MNDKIKEEIIELLQNVDDENYLQVLKEDLVEYKTNQKDVLDDLSPEDLADLKQIAEEDDFKDTITEEELFKSLARWNTK